MNQNVLNEATKIVNGMTLKQKIGQMIMASIVSATSFYSVRTA